MNKYLKFLIKWSSVVVFICIMLFLIALLVLSQSKFLRLKAMRFGLKSMSKTRKPDGTKPFFCGNYESVHGVVADLGAGGANLMNCWDPDTPISKYIAIEPNYLAHDMIDEKKKNYSMEFEHEIVEDISMIKTNSIDYLVTTKTMCSIDDLEHIFENIDRILKPGGEFIYFEHVIAHEYGLRWIAQIILYPVFRIIGDGCNMRKYTRSYLEEYFFQKKKGKYGEKNFEAYVEAEMPFFVRSCIKGVIFKAEEDVLVGGEVKEVPSEEVQEEVVKQSKNIVQEEVKQYENIVQEEVKQYENVVPDPEETIKTENDNFPDEVKEAENVIPEILIVKQTENIVPEEEVKDIENSVQDNLEHDESKEEKKKEKKKKKKKKNKKKKKKKKDGKNETSK